MAFPVIIFADDGAFGGSTSVAFDKDEYMNLQDSISNTESSGEKNVYYRWYVYYGRLEYYRWMHLVWVIGQEFLIFCTVIKWMSRGCGPNFGSQAAWKR